MSERQPVEEKNLDIYGNPPFPWSDVRNVLAVRQGIEVPCFLGTLRPDGRLYAAGIAPMWYDGDFYFTSSLNARKAKNLATHPGCTLSCHYPGFDVTIEGHASGVADPAILETVAALYREDGWPTEVSGDALTAPYSAQSAGPAPWHVFRLEFDAVTALKLEENGGAMRWRFEGK